LQQYYSSDFSGYKKPLFGLKKTKLEHWNQNLDLRKIKDTRKRGY